MCSIDNLIVLIDKNGLQGFGNTNEVLGVSADAAKWQVMGFEVIEADGHDVATLIAIIAQLKQSKNEKPKVIIANTIKGKGVSFMENNADWHGSPPNQAQRDAAIKELMLT